MKRGEVWRVDLPTARGHVQAGKRPAVILQDDQVTASLPTFLIVPFTGSHATLRFPGRWQFSPTARTA
jgi:mRNA-degrading endonuclease toxin of MazEF toxin-antitoxin module